jgi:hypothetical protein
MSESVTKFVVGSLLALAEWPEYVKPFETSDALLMRHFGIDPFNDGMVHICEVADFKHERYVWSLNIPMAEFPASPEGQIALSGKLMNAGSTREILAEMVEDQYAREGHLITLLEDTPKRKAWHVKLSAGQSSEEEPSEEEPSEEESEVEEPSMMEA